MLGTEIVTCFLADPWGITVLTEDVKGSFDSIEYQGTAIFD